MAKAPTDIRSLARSHTASALKVLAGIMQEANAPPAARVQAATALLDRGFGKPTQHVEARVGPLDNLSLDEQRSLEAALAALSGDTEDAASGTDETHH